jgi:hypothetical protein
MAEEEKKSKRVGGIESSLDGIASFYSIASIVVLVICVLYSQQELIKKTDLSIFLIILGVGVAFQGFVFRSIFKAAAEVIRLLKRLNGLTYGGSLSVTETEAEEDKAFFFCSECGEQVANKDKHCSQCGASL